MNYLFNNLLKSSRFTKQDFKNFPKYSNGDRNNDKIESFIPFIFWLFFILIVLSVIIFNKK